MPLPLRFREGFLLFSDETRCEPLVASRACGTFLLVASDEGVAMRIQHLTPHQFAPLAENFDTLIVRSYSPAPLDIAAPCSASALISAEVAHLLAARFAGRATLIDAGAVPVGDVVDIVERLQPLWPHPIRFAVWITDRTLLMDTAIYQGRVTVLCVDWWRWLVNRVPANRLCDAWMYLALACPEYWGSAERRQLGLDEPTASAMAAEGRKLLAALEEFAVAAVTRLWEADRSRTGA
jgi:hypothetical protein